MRFLNWCAALSVGAMVLVTPLAAQEPTFGMGLGRSIGGSPFSDRYIHDGSDGGGPEETGWQLQTFSEWSPAGARFTFRAEALYSRLRVNTRAGQWFATVGSILSPQPSDDGFQPYVIAGGAFFLNRGGAASETVSGAPSLDWAWVPGVNAGAGFAVDILSLRAGAEVRHHEGLFDDNGSGWIDISLLVRLP